MESIFDQNKFMLRMQISSLLEQSTSDLTKKHYKLFTLEQTSFVIAISVIKTENIWFETYYLTEGLKTHSKRHKVYGKQLSHVADEVMNRLTRNEIENAENILLRESKKPKALPKVETIEEEAPRFKRNSRPQPKVETVEKQVSDKKKAITESDKRKAELERKLFKDPRMWEFES